MRHFIQGFCCLLLLTVSATTFAKDKSNKKEEQKRHNAFTKKMKNIALVGAFTIDGHQSSAKKERYEIKSAKRVKGDDWIITARIKYGKTDLELPVAVKVFWAGDTPVITMTNMEIPLLGTFTTRVMIYENRYAGTWQHGKAGGLMHGHIEKIKEQKKEKPKSKSK
ncbi:hypothetical protein MNBD_PLANCTO02-254 [hydrothermal vent metagenome]|uniref:Uncharacterized protein n=1 Tax=hydrothermal vent metagenome TaxID=652676 RepID=A0A3B1E5J9_9ZZZZ